MQIKDSTLFMAGELRRRAETINQTDNDMMNICSKMETLIDIPSEDEVLLERIRRLDTPID